MYPELFELPFIHITVKTYGLIMIVGFLAALFLMRKLAVVAKENPTHVSNAALYALVVGVIGSRFFYVVHHYSDFRGGPWWEVFATWRGGLELVGGVILSIIVTILYLLKQKLSVRTYLDILAIGLILGLTFGRIGCFFSGCGWGKPTDAAWGIRFPYASEPHHSQVNPDITRGRTNPHLVLPEDYFMYIDKSGTEKFPNFLKPFELLTPQQQYEVTKGKYRPLAVHPIQLLSSFSAFILCAVLCIVWLKFLRKRPGRTFFLMLILYGVIRFFLEYLRDDNPLEFGKWTLYNGGTVSQNLGLYLSVFGLFGWFLLAKKADQPSTTGTDQENIEEPKNNEK